MPDMNPQPEAEGESIRSLLEAGFSGSESPPPEPEVSDGATQPASDDAPAADLPPDPPAAGAVKPDHPTDPMRYADGTFKRSKADKPEAAPAKAAPDKPEIPSTDAAKVSEEPASKPTVAPPAGWTAAEKAEWSKLSPAVQAAVSRREAQIDSGARQWSEQKQRYEAVLSPVTRAASRYGLSTEQGLNALLAAQAHLERDPADAIRTLARNHGVDLATLAGQPADGSERTTPQPDIAALVRQAVQPIVAPIHERFAAEDRHREQSTVSLVSDFAAAPGHEHFEAVHEHVLSLIPTIKAQNPAWTHNQVLDAAYDQAVWANPTTRQAMTEAKQHEAEQARVAEAKRRASSARTAAASLTGSPTGTGGVSPKGTIREELEAAFAGRA
jgi:hypothetical protein